MRGDNFWRGVIVLCLTLLAGVFVADFFESGKEKQKFAVINKELNCQPADSNLKNYKLSKTEVPSKQEPRAVTGGSVIPDHENLEGLESETKGLLFRPAKDKFDSVTLLHKENCYEINGRK